MFVERCNQGHAKPACARWPRLTGMSTRTWLKVQAACILVAKPGVESLHEQVMKVGHAWSYTSCMSVHYVMLAPRCAHAGR